MNSSPRQAAGYSSKASIKVQTSPESVKRELVEKDHQELSVRRQCEILDFNRSSLYYKRTGLSEEDQNILEEMD